MELTSIQIQHYRSIENVTIEVRDRCLIFLGINESGKSNILKAISALSKDFKFNFQEDSKMPVKDDYYTFRTPTICYNFKLDKEGKKQLLKEAFGENYTDWQIKYNPEHCKSLAEFIELFIGNTGYKLTLKEDNTLASTVLYSLPDRYFTVKDNFFSCNNNVQASIGGTNRIIAKGEIINCEEIINFDTIKQHFQKLTKEMVSEKFLNVLVRHVKANLPSVVLWQYDHNYLLSNSIDINSFKSNPDSCLPLKNIFRLAGITDINDRITKDYANDSAFLNLKRTLSKAATKHVNQVWKDYKDIKIEVGERNGKFVVQVLDAKNLYNFKQRSDGFKRFISFLFMLSAQYEAGELFDCILIFDEPDISLHPSGTRHLLKEILELSRHNYCFVASHSIFFIDKDNIPRHVIVNKENESTIIQYADYQNFAEEEVLYQALGFSIFDILKKRNICFEGWTDKEVFKVLTNLFERDITGLDAYIESIGILWSSTANKICQTIKPFVNNNERLFFAVADFDGAERSEIEIFKKELSDTNSKFFTYKDFSRRHLKDLTLEDILPEGLMIDFFNKHLSTIIESPNPKFTKGRISNTGIINSWNSFCEKEYKAKKDQLKSAYKNKIPGYIRDYIDKHKSNTESLKADFKGYKEFLEQLISKTESDGHASNRPKNRKEI